MGQNRQNGRGRPSCFQRRIYLSIEHIVSEIFFSGVEQTTKIFERHGHKIELKLTSRLDQKAVKCVGNYFERPLVTVQNEKQTGAVETSVRVSNLIITKQFECISSSHLLFFSHSHSSLNLANFKYAHSFELPCPLLFVARAWFALSLLQTYIERFGRATAATSVRVCVCTDRMSVCVWLCLIQELTYTNFSLFYLIAEQRRERKVHHRVVIQSKLSQSRTLQ